MKVLALISGGKDSCYNMMQCVAEGHSIVALANLKPNIQDELDSYMYQTVGHHAIGLYAEAMQLPLYRRTITGKSLQIGRDYVPESGDEVEDLFALIKEVQSEVEFDAVSVGAILSDYQRVRVENVCSRLSLTVLGYLWRRDQQELLQEMIDSELHAIIIKVASLGLDTTHLGKSLAEMHPHLTKMSAKYGLNVCGEGGEYETFTLDCPLFKKSIVIDETKEILHSKDAFAPVGYLNIVNAHLEDKHQESAPCVQQSSSTNQQLLKELFDDQSYTVDTDVAEGVMSHKASCTPLEHTDVSMCKNKEGFMWICGVSSPTQCCVQNDTHTAMQILTKQLEEEGCTLKDVIAVCMYVKNMDDFKYINTAYKTYFSLNPPSRICVEACLAENVSIQLDCIVWKQQADVDRHTMHVQGLSHWAPANIGPYSQAVQVGEWLYIAGQIGICPSDLSLIEGGILPQSRLSLRHVTRILAGMSTTLTLKNIVQCVCYVTSRQHIKHARTEWRLAVEREGRGVHAAQTYVIVPGLPKGALVEWQVWAHTDTDTKSDLMNLTKGDITASLTYIQVPEKPAHYACRVSITNNRETSISADEAVGACVELLNGWFRKSGLESSSFRGCRLFHSVTCFPDQQVLKRAWEQSFAACQTQDAAPAVSLVPVQGFEDEHCVLTVVI